MKALSRSGTSCAPAFQFRYAAIAAAVLAACGAQSGAHAQMAPGNATGPGGADIPAVSGSAALSYTGALSQVGIGLDRDSHIRGQASHVLREDDLSALIAQGWLGGGSGGLRLDYNWIEGQDGKPAADGMVRKLFAAVDRNREADRKMTVGFGLESENWFGNVSYSHGLSDRRWIGSASTTETTEQQSGTEVGRPYIDTLTTSTTTRFYEQAYDHGVGLRVGYLYPDSLLRVSLGLDREWGDFSARQNTVSLGFEKFFAGSPHSLGLSLEQYNKSGEYETRGNGSRIQLMYRFSFGGSAAASSAGWRETRRTKDVQIPAAAGPDVQIRQATAPIVQNRKELRIVKTTASMTSDAFFELNKAELTMAAKTELDRVAKVLKNTDRVGNIKVTGHTCDIGAEAYNLKLSLRRATSVRDYLADRGKLPPDIFVIEGLGESQPKYPNNTRALRAKNRRVDLEFVTYQDKSEEVQIPVELNTQVPSAPTAVQWKTEVIESEPAWVRRALRNTVPHKQTVDTYRGAEISQTTTSSRAYLNRAPVTQDDSVAATAGIPATINVLANDSDPDGNALSIAAVSAPAHGSAVVSGNTVIYTPTSGFSGVDSFSYTVDDGAGGRATAKVTATVQRANQAPLAQDDSVAATAGIPATINALANDSDPDGNALSIAAVSAPAHGTATISGNAIVYTSASGFTGVDSFSYTVDDGAGGRATAKVTATVQRANQAPLAQDDSVAATAGIPATINVLANDSDPDGNALSIAAVSAPAHGSAVVSGNTVIYTPTSGFSGADSFSYTVDDGAGGRATAKVTATVQRANQPPLAQDDSVAATAGIPATINVLANDSDPDGNALSIASVSAPAHGTATISGNAIVYTSASGFTGVDSFSYTVDDGAGGRATAKVTATVQRANQPPLARDDRYTVGNAGTWPMDVLANDSDPDGDTISIVSFTQPSTGVVTQVGTSLSFLSTGSFYGTSFTYTINDGHGGTSTATVNLIDP